MKKEYVGFIAAGEVIGSKHQVRSVEIVDDPNLPDGNYEFMDCYCTDMDCDCRKSIIQVYLNSQLVSAINYGWEDTEHYCRWMSAEGEDDIARSMTGVSIDIAGPNRVSRKGLLILFNHLLDDDWKSIIQDNYKKVRDIVRESKGK